MILIIGAGASGIMAAITVAKAGKEVYLIEHNKAVGRKILVSGGGKCNVTNRNIRTTDYFTHQPDFCNSALRKFTTADALAMLSDAGIEIEDRDYGRVFCKTNASELLGYLKQELKRWGVKLLLDTKVNSITFDQGIQVHTDTATYQPTSLLLATGGLAWPQIGASDFAFQIAKQVGHKIYPAQPALTGFTLETGSPYLNLRGINLLVESWIDPAHRACEPMVFTFKGLSGPAMLQTSCYWTKGAVLHINWLPKNSILELMHDSANGKLNLKTLLNYHLAQRLVETLFSDELLSQKIARLSKVDRKTIAQTVHDFQIIPSGLEGFKKAETTLGGVDTTHINPKTMESLLQPGLFMTGEVLDVAGRLGGYNIHWAFASGKAAGKAMSV